MTDEQGRRIPIVDRRVAHQDASATAADASAAPAEPGGSDPVDDIVEAATAEITGAAEAQSDFLDDLRRLQADFDNYRKRMMREQAATAGRAKARLIEQMLPVLDAFDQALEHEGGAGGMDLIYKQLKTTLEAEGLEEIAAEGVPFDPHVHDAVDSREDPEVQEIVCRSVYRRGYRVGDQVLRAAMVVVARPPEAAEDASAEAHPADPAAPEAAEG